MSDEKQAPAAPEAFNDGITSFVNQLANQRNALAENTITARRLTITDMRSAWRTGLGSKICRIKTGGALNDTLQFTGGTADELYYNITLAHLVRTTCRFMLGFGRGIIVLHKLGDDLSQPLSGLTRENAIIKAFSGDMVTVSQISRDLSSERYYKPLAYQVRGQSIHWTRVIDFTYVEPVEDESSLYGYGGISEFELIWPQMINDGVVERATGSIVEKSSTFVHQMEGFDDLLQQKREGQAVRYAATAAQARSIYGTYLVDAKDTVTTVTQQLSNLSDVNLITLQRLAMVTGIPLPMLVGEAVKGLNSSGDTETKTFQDMLETLQEDYLLEPLNDLAAKLKMEPIEFKDNQGQTPLNKVEFETKAIANAAQLEMMGQDGAGYLKQYDIAGQDDYDAFFSEPEQV